MVLWKMSLQNLLAYRANFINSVISSLSWGIFSVISVILLTSKTNMIYGWTKTDILLLTCGYQILIGVFHTLFSGNFERMAEIIHLGQMDSLLIKPLDSQFMLSVWRVNYTSLIRIIIGIAFLGYFVNAHAVYLSLPGLLFFVFLLAVGLILLYSIWYMIVTLIIWFPRMSNVVELMYTVSGFARYPQEMYKNSLGPLFFVLLPVLVVVTIPVRLLISRIQPSEVFLMMFFSVAFFTASRRFWKFALRHYTSASS